MKSGPIEIDIENDQTGSITTQLALDLDKPKVLKGILSLRKKFLNSKTYTNVGEFLAPLGTHDKLEDNIRNLIYTNQLPSNYFGVIFEAVITGKVTSYSRVEHVYIPRTELEKLTHFYYQVGEDYEYVLRVSLDATEEEIVKAFRELKRMVKESPKDFRPPRADTISNIRRDRRWYWLHQPKQRGGQGMSYYQIALKETKNQNREVVRKAIKQYESRLLKASDKET